MNLRCGVLPLVALAALLSVCMHVALEFGEHAHVVVPLRLRRAHVPHEPTAVVVAAPSTHNVLAIGGTATSTSSVERVAAAESTSTSVATTTTRTATLPSSSALEWCSLRDTRCPLSNVSAPSTSTVAPPPPAVFVRSTASSALPIGECWLLAAGDLHRLSSCACSPSSLAALAACAARARHDAERAYDASRRKPNAYCQRPLRVVRTDEQRARRQFVTRVRASIAASPSARPTTLSSIVVVGERHSGTGFVADLLQMAFPSASVSQTLMRWKHWRQDEWLLYESPYRLVDLTTTLVVLATRNPYDWLVSMRSCPYHAIAHTGLRKRLGLVDFARHPWFWPDGKHRLAPSPGNGSAPVCMHQHRPHEIEPCFCSRQTTSLGEDFYELDTSTTPSQPFASMLALRASKATNHLNISAWMPHFSHVRTEDLIDARRDTRGAAARRWLHALRQQFPSLPTLADAFAAVDSAERDQRLPAYWNMNKIVTPADDLAAVLRKNSFYLSRTFGNYHTSLLDAGALTQLNELVDWRVEERLGYSRLDIADIGVVQ